jgi:hypothetical protein
MPLTADQRATLQLLLERGQSYADLSALLDVEEAEVRERARGALRELAGADPDRNVGLTDFLLGQADPIGRADAVRHLREDPDDHRLASELASELREAFPGAQLPRLPGEPRPTRFRRRTPSTGEREPEVGEGRSVAARLSPRQARLVVVLASAAILLVAVVLGVTGAFGGGDDDSGSGAETTTTAGDGDVTTDPGEELTRVELTPPGGGNATGEAIFGLATNDQPYVDMTIEGLDAAPRDETYVVWLMLTADQGYPLAPIAVNQRGGFSDRFSIPATVLPIVARVRSVDVALAPVREVGRAIRRAISGSELVLERPGRTVLGGEIPRAEGQGSGSAGTNG